MKAGRTKRMIRTAAETISMAAMRESCNAMYRKSNNTSKISQKTFVPGKVYNYLVALDDQPITLNDFRALKPNIRATHGFYTIQYIPSGSVKRNPKFPYLIGQDLVRIRVTVSGPRHWAAMCSRIPELDWVRRNSTLSDAMFGIAKKHPGLVLRFGIDFVKYCDKITKRAEELGVDIDNKPLVMFQWGADSVPDVEGGDLACVKTKKDYASIIKELNEASEGEEGI